MEKLNAQQILEIVENSGISVDDFAYGDFEIESLGDWEEVEQKGGEDEGSHWYSVKYFKTHDVYIMTTGYYQSHYGCEFYDGFGKEVKPKEKTITVYA